MIVKYSGYKSKDYDEDLLLSVQSKSGSTYKGASSGAPTLPKISSLERASTVGNPSVYTPKQTTLPKRTVTVGPKQWSRETATNNLTTKAPTVSTPSKFTSALEKASVASDLTPTTREMNRSNNFLKGVGTSFAATIPTLIDTTKQSLSDWQDKVRQEGLRKSLTEMSMNMDNPNWTYGKPVSQDSTGYKLYQRANEYFNKAQQGLTPSQQQAMGIAASLAQNAVTLPTALINPSAPLIIMGANAAANRANELTAQGKTATEALGRGLLSGSLEALTEKIPLENLISVAKTGGKSAVKNVLQQMGTEGAEELASYIMNYAADVSAGDENANFSTQEALQNFLGGAISGGIMGGATTAIGSMPSYRQMAADNITYNDILPRGNANYSSDISNADINIARRNANGTTNVLPVSQYIDEYSGRTTPTATNTETVEFKPSGEFEVDDGSLSKRDVSAYNFVKSKADELNTTTQKVYDAYKKGRDNLYNKIVDEWYNTYKNYKPQGTQLVKSNNEYIGEVPVDRYTRISNNEPWYSEVYAIYGHKPNQSQLRQFVETKVTNDINSGNGEYVDAETAKTIRTYDNLLEGYNKVTSNGEKNVIDIRLNDNGNYEVDYGDITVPDSNVNLNKNIQTETTSIPSVDETVDNTPSKDSLGIVNQDVLQLFEDAQTAKKGIAGALKKGYQSAISGWAPFENITKADTRKNARNISALVNKYAQKGGITDTILTKGMFDINGNKIDDRSFVDVASQVPKDQKALFNEYWDELHNIDRQAQDKPVTSHTIEESKQIVADLESKYPEFKTMQKDISAYLDKFVQTWGVDTGLISPQAYLEMKQMYPNYVPTYRVDEGSGTGSSYARSGKKIKGGTGIGRAKGSTAEVMSFDEAIAKKMSTIIAAATKNDISQEIFSFAQTMPAEAAKNGILIETNNADQYKGQIDLDEYIDNVDKNIAKEISKGNYEITFYENGKPQTMKISREVWEAFNFLDSKLGGVQALEYAAKIGRAFTNPMRALTTTYNPLFFMTNLMRDAQTYAINNSAKNSAVALKNYIKAIKGVATNSDLYQQYRALGGSQNGYYGSDIYEQAYNRVNPLSKSASNKVRDVVGFLPKAIESAGEFTEKLPRFAEYLNTIDRLGNTDAGRLQASLNAADVTVNFNRSSTLSTFANAFVPYFNAGLQGMDRTFRQIKAHPVKTTARATASVFLPTLILYLVNKDNPHWEDVKDGVKDSYYLIPNTFGPTDENGYAETFIRLPKSREFGALFSASFERFIRAFDESEETGKGLTETLPKAFTGYTDTLANSVSPPDILGDNILGSIRRLGTNTAWHGGTIIPSNLENVSPENQYDINTSGLAMQIAERAQKIPGAPDWLRSPMKVDYLIDSYGGYGGDLLQGLTSRKNIGSTESETLKNSLYTGVVQPFINRLTTDSAYSSYNLDRFYDEIDNIQTAANDRNINENLPSEYRTPEEKVLSDFTSARNDISDITKQERAILESAMPIAEKNKQIRELKQQKNEIAKNMLQSEDDLYSNYQDLYIPVISGLTDSRQEAARQLNKEYGLTYDEYADLYAKYSEINKEDIKPRMKATKFEEYLNSLGYTDQYKITPVLKDEFSYFTASPATSYYDSKSYQLVDGILPVETYADLSSLVYGLESGVDYPKGEKSPFAKSLIDAYLEKYGYNPTANERAKIYDAMGVSKSYWY